MINVPSRVQWEDLVRAEEWAPWRTGWADTRAHGPVAAKASVARLKAIEDRIDAYDKARCAAEVVAALDPETRASTT